MSQIRLTRSVTVSTYRLLQVLVVLSTLALFCYLLLYALAKSSPNQGPDYSWLKTRNMSAYLRPEEGDATTLMEPLKKCRKEDRLRMVVMVFSAPSYFQRRDIVRRTWGAGLRELPGVKLFFLMGVGATKETQALITSEQRQHDDLVQLDFFDSYANLTIKTSFMLKWINSPQSGCTSAKFFFKVDDDAFVNPKVLWENLEHALLHTATTKSFINYLPPQPEEEEEKEIENEDDLIRSRASQSIDYLFMGHAQKAVPIRDPSSKWYLPSRFYPLNIFPLFVSGCGYVVSTSVAPMLYQCALKTPYMNLEDVFISGLCAGTQLGLKLTHNPTFHFRKPLIGSDYICYYKQASLMHPVKPGQVTDLYQRVLHDDHNCDTFYFSFVRAANVVADFIKNLFRL